MQTETYDLSFLLGFKLLVELSQTRRPIVMGITTGNHHGRGCHGLRTGSCGTSLAVLVICDHLTRAGKRRIVKLQVHENRRQSSAGVG